MSCGSLPPRIFSCNVYGRPGGRQASPAYRSDRDSDKKPPPRLHQKMSAVPSSVCFSFLRLVTRPVLKEAGKLAVSPRTGTIYKKSQRQGLSGPCWFIPRGLRPEGGWASREEGRTLLCNAAPLSRRKPRRPLAGDNTERDRQSQTSLISHQCRPQRALGTALLAARVLVAVGSWPDCREIPDFGGSGRK